MTVPYLDEIRIKQCSDSKEDAILGSGNLFFTTFPIVQGCYKVKKVHTSCSLMRNWHFDNKMY